jgi:hypothetical protein
MSNQQTLKQISNYIDEKGDLIIDKYKINNDNIDIPRITMVNIPNLNIKRLNIGLYAEEQSKLCKYENKFKLGSKTSHCNKISINITLDSINNNALKKINNI